MGTASRKFRRNAGISALLDEVLVVVMHGVVAMVPDVMTMMLDVVAMMYNVMMMHDMVMLHHGRGIGAADHRCGEGERDGKAERGKKGLLHDISLLAAGETRPTC
jgi:hypothetical protein